MQLRSIVTGQMWVDYSPDNYINGGVGQYRHIPTITKLEVSLSDHTLNAATYNYLESSSLHQLFRMPSNANLHDNMYMWNKCTVYVA